jgi:hypothetical protein
MRLTKYARRFPMLALVAVLAACSGGTTDSGALLDLNNLGGDNGGGSNVTSAKVAIVGPTCVQTDQISDAFTATATTTAGTPIKDKFIQVVPTFNGSPAGTIQATGPDGRPRLGGANTDNNGNMVFRYQPPTDINTSITVLLTANVKDGDTTIGKTESSITVAPPGKPKITVAGPQDPATGQRISSGNLNVKAGQIASGFLATVQAPSACSSNQLVAVKGVTVTATPTNTAASIQQDNTDTGTDGTALFSYVAPDSVTSKTKDTITVKASTAGGTAQTTYVLNLLPGAGPSTLKLALTGPTSVTAGRETEGYTATLQESQTDGDGTVTVVARPDVQLTFTASDSGTMTAADGGKGIGKTIDDGTAKASYKSTASGTSAQEVTLTAAVTSAAGSDVTTICQRQGSACTATLKVRVQPDTFVFASPVYGKTQLVGKNNAQPLTFSWLSNNSEGINGCVDLTAKFQGGSSSPFGVIIGDDPATATAQIKRVQVTNGNFANKISLFSDLSGFVELTAVENRNCADAPAGSLTTTTGVQFTDDICQTTSDGKNCVDLQAPLQVKSSPDASGNQRVADLKFEVRNNAYQPVDGAQVTFAISNDNGRADPNERVFPGGGTTDASGIANSKYYVPVLAPVNTDTNGDGVVNQNDTRTELVDIQACVRRMGTENTQAATVCSTRRIQIVVTGPAG